MNEEVKPGYKQTEVGVIPEDWECVQIGKLIDLLTGHPFPSTGYSKSGIKLLRGSNVKRGITDWSEDITEYWPEINLEIKKYLLKSDDIVVAMDGSLVGRSYAMLSKIDLPALLLQRVARIRANTIAQKFLKHWVCSQRFTEHCDAVKTVTAIPHISPADIQSFTIAVPPTKAEQEAIAEALSDADALIESLVQLIQKKRLIKQGAMQELLTGKKRLPGFSGEWEEKRLCDFGSTYGGLTNKVKADFGEGTSSYVTFMNIMSNVVIDCSAFEKLRIHAGESQNQVMKGDLFFNGSSETPEEVGMCSVLTQEVHDVYLNSFCFGFRFRNNTEAYGHYLAYFFRGNQGRELLKSLAQGATRYNLSKNALMKVFFTIPSIQEQTAIAEILSDMDAELAEIERKMEKARQLKQGMMQNLLTGKIRLI